MATVTVLPINIYQGADFALGFSLKNADNTPYDLTGCSAQAQMRHNVTGLLIQEFTIDITALEGLILMTLTGSQTALITAVVSPDNVRRITQFLWDIKVILASGVIVRLYEGPVEFSPQVTHA